MQKTPEISAVKRTETDRPRSMRIGWVVPTVEPGQGGLRNIFRMCRHLSYFGHHVTAYCEPGPHASTKETLSLLISDNYGPMNFSVDIGVPAGQEFDVLVATFWRTAPSVAAYPHTHGRAYLVQDFEPYFYPMGDSYLRAENTYRLGLETVTSGPWCSAKLKELYGVNAEYFTFPVDHTVYHPTAVARDAKRIAFFARPEMPRRCFDLGCEALALVAAIQPDVEVMLFGSSHSIPSGLAFRHRNMGVMKLPALAKLYNSCSIGIAFSTTNPSLVPYEMMACGLPVVDLDLPGAEASYDGREAVELVHPLPTAIADSILQLLSSPALQARRREAGTRLATGMMSEEQAARVVESVCMRSITRSHGIDVLNSPSSISPYANANTAPQSTWHHYRELTLIGEATPEDSHEIKISTLDKATIRIPASLMPIACIDLHLKTIDAAQSTHLSFSASLPENPAVSAQVSQVPLRYCRPDTWLRLHVPEALQIKGTILQFDLDNKGLKGSDYISFSTSLDMPPNLTIDLDIDTNAATIYSAPACRIYAFTNKKDQQTGTAPAFALLPGETRNGMKNPHGANVLATATPDDIATELQLLTAELRRVGDHLSLLSRIAPVIEKGFRQLRSRYRAFRQQLMLISGRIVQGSKI